MVIEVSTYFLCLSRDAPEIRSADENWYLL